MKMKGYGDKTIIPCPYCDKDMTLKIDPFNGSVWLCISCGIYINEDCDMYDINNMTLAM